MASRPAWSFDENTKSLKRSYYEFVFNSGFSQTQKQKNIVALHNSIGKKVLEVSTKSFDEIGIRLSVFNLKLNGVPLENVFQASKKYEKGGPYLDLLSVHPREAKRDERHHSSGKLVSFVYNEKEFPLEPKTVAMLKAFLVMYGEVPDLRGKYEDFVRFYKVIKADKV